MKLSIDGFNEAFKNIAAIYLRVGDDYMSAIRFRRTKTGNLPHLSYIFCNTDTLGTEFKKVVFYVTG